ncbi:hypothetical protein SR1949_25940 [Sphaerospermopsis reniformis]|uniref:Toprim domain-containing protein n=1 Tax=Sphaerospermopsis reniformis TaxID=531300 RepID=A0A480A191_9CYAN|nr:hypothetical protein [Sphaerospermopsis reniformis]GCL37483.1 hypothetical protein SR1949_25940 [Sphaerospermopsis reniformis]
MKRQYTTKRNPCPVCGNHHGCAIRSDNLIECLRSFSQYDAPAGYRFIKLLRNDMGGLFVPDDKSGQIQGERLSSPQSRAGSRKINKGLSIEERNRQNRLLLNSTVSSLGTQHISHLQTQRQLTTQEINWLKDLGWVRSWEPGLSAPVGVTSALAGVSLEGRLLGREGIAIAALDPNFQITGFQIATLQTKPKYIWLSSSNQGGNGPHLPNGELPLFCWKHPNSKRAKVVILCEGALKSLLTAVFLWRSGQTDIAVIGTAVAARYGNKTLKDYLKRLRPQKIRLMPDAGAILNPHIAQGNEDTLQQCRKCRYHLSVGDWGQLETKEQLDIDELLAVGRQDEIKLISTAAYLNRHHIHQQIRKLLKQGSFQLVQDKLITLKPAPNSTDNLDLIQQYAKGVEYCRKGGYQVMVSWNNEAIPSPCPPHTAPLPLLTPEEFFAGCSEQVQQSLAQIDREWGMLYKLKLWFGRMVERYRPKNGFGQQNSGVSDRYEPQRHRVHGERKDKVKRFDAALQGDGVFKGDFSVSSFGLNADHDGFSRITNRRTEYREDGKTELSTDQGVTELLDQDECNFQINEPQRTQRTRRKESLRDIVPNSFTSQPDEKQLLSEDEQGLSSPIAPCNVIEYKPGKFAKYGTLQQPPKIIFKKGQRLQVYAEAIAAGWKHILDKSPTGTFKSHDAGTALPTALGVEKLWYFTSHARNVSTETIERNYEYLDVRNSGMVWDTTPNGKRYLRWPKQGETPDTKGNCHRSQIFNVLRSKNLDSIEGAENPICATCHLLEACRGCAGPGFGHRFLRKETFKSDRIRSHPDSAPQPEDFDWSTSGIFWDEVMQTVQPVNTITANLRDIDQVMAELMTHSPEISLQLQPMWAVLRECITGDIQQPYYGWNDAGVRGMLGKAPENLDEIITEVMQILQPDLLPIFNSTSRYGVDLSDLPKKVRKQFGNPISELVDKIQTEVVVNWFVPFLQVWSRKIPGAMRIDNGKLSVTTRNSRHSAISQSTLWNVYLDATTKPEYIAWWFDIEPEAILTVEQEIRKPNNLQIIQITGLGQVSKNRSSYCQERVSALRQELLSRHSDIKFIDFVKCCENEDGGWFRDSRGSNDFQEITALATFGIPYQNIGHLETLYLTLKPTDEQVNYHNWDDGKLNHRNSNKPLSYSKINQDLQKFIDWVTQSEIIQAIGRLRVNNRRESELNFYFCADYDLSFLEHEIKYIQAAEMTIEAGSKDEKSWWKIETAVKELWLQGQKITQPVVAAVSGMSQGYISKLATEFGGGWKQWLKIFLSLLNSNNSKRNNLDDISDVVKEELEMTDIDFSLQNFETKSHQEIVKTVFAIDKHLDDIDWQYFLDEMPIKSQSKIIAALLSILPKCWVQELITQVASYGEERSLRLYFVKSVGQ